MIRSILKEIFPSVEMADYLARCPFGDEIVCERNGRFDDAPPETLPLTRSQLAHAIAGAPVSLKRKWELFLELAVGEKDGYFSSLADRLGHAVQEMQPEPGAFFYLKSCRSEEDGVAEQGLEPYLTWEHIFERIEAYRGDMDADEKEQTWFTIEKWSPDGGGRLKNDYDYILLGSDVCYFASAHKEPIELNSYRDLNLPVPFHAGEIVTVDCRPFAPVSHVVILEIQDNCDCCSLQALYHVGGGMWDMGAVKHGHIFPGIYWGRLSALYRLASFHGELPEEERLLETVSSFLNGEERRGAALWNAIYALHDPRQKIRVTEEQILSFL